MAKPTKKEKVNGGYEYIKVTCQCSREQEIEIRTPHVGFAYYCGACGKIIDDSGQKYCGYCGKEIDWED